MPDIIIIQMNLTNVLSRQNWQSASLATPGQTLNESQCVADKIDS